MEQKWIRAHSTAQFEALPMTAPRNGGKTIRTEVTVGLSGSALRLVLGQDYGKPISYGSVKIRLRDTVYTLTFGGAAAVTAQKGCRITSDPVNVSVQADDRVTIWLYREDPGYAATASILPACHSPAGDFTGEDFEPEPYGNLFGDQEACSGYCGLEVLREKSGRVFALVGDSICAMELWTKPVQEQLLRRDVDAALLNMGISGNRLLLPTNIPGFRGAQFFGDSGLDRLERDALNIPGVTAVILALGINDISQPGGERLMSPPPEERCSAEDLIAGIEQVIRRCRERGLTVYGCTITPFGGLYSGCPETYRIRNQVNDRIRTPGVFDKVIDFAAAIEDPTAPDFLKPDCDSGDHLHPNAHGGEVMAEVFLQAVSC